MFVRFRPTSRRLQASLVETHRHDRRVRHEHVASLGSIPLAMTTADRFVFWSALHERLARLGNRLNAADQHKIMAAIHARIPMPTVEDQEVAANAGREANAGLLAVLKDKHRDLAEHHRRAAETETAAAAAVDGLEDAYADRPLTLAEAQRLFGGAVKVRQMLEVAELFRLAGADADADAERSLMKTLVDESVKAGDRAHRRTVRRLLAAARAGR
jgi:hypothetical protein